MSKDLEEMYVFLNLLSEIEGPVHIYKRKHHIKNSYR